MTFSRVPYSIALRAGQAETKILNELCAELKIGENPEKVDLNLAAELIRKHLHPILGTGSK